jgi:hypothetical protein
LLCDEPPDDNWQQGPQGVDTAAGYQREYDQMLHGHSA